MAGPEAAVHVNSPGHARRTNSRKSFGPGFDSRRLHSVTTRPHSASSPGGVVSIRPPTPSPPVDGRGAGWRRPCGPATVAWTSWRRTSRPSSVSWKVSLSGAPGSDTLQESPVPRLPLVDSSRLPWTTPRNPGLPPVNAIPPGGLPGRAAATRSRSPSIPGASIGLAPRYCGAPHPGSPGAPRPGPPTSGEPPPLERAAATRRCCARTGRMDAPGVGAPRGRGTAARSWNALH